MFSVCVNLNLKLKAFFFCQGFCFFRKTIIIFLNERFAYQSETLTKQMKCRSDHEGNINIPYAPERRNPVLLTEVIEIQSQNISGAKSDLPNTKKGPINYDSFTEGCQMRVIIVNIISERVWLL